MASAEVAGCKISSWQVERHTFFGDAKTISQKLMDTNVGLGRRLFYAVLEGDGNVGRVFEFEHKKDKTYEVRVAETHNAHKFNHAADRATFENKGQSCVGQAVQALPEYQEQTLKFHKLSEHDLKDKHEFAEVLPLDANAKHASKDLHEQFLRASFHLLC